MKAVIFDLDDTLYPEIEFVKSGFRIVAHYLSSRNFFDEEFVFEGILKIFEEEGRGKVFDRVLAKLDIYTDENVKKLIYIYRSHYPVISLYEDVLPTLKELRYRNMRLGMVTDGMASVQRKKISALKLNRHFDVIMCSDELGKECWKPSTIPYHIVLDLLQVSPSEGAYIGDNPSKDFLGANRLGMLTIQVNRQDDCGKNQVVSGQHCARYVISKLEELLPIIRDN